MTEEGDLHHRVRILKAQGKLARIPTSAIMEETKPRRRAIYADFVGTAMRRRMPRDPEAEEDPDLVARLLARLTPRRS